MADREPLPAPDDPRDWTPMRPYQGRRKFDIIDPVAEPLWSGVRVLVHFRSRPGDEPPAEVKLIEELGVDLSEELPALSEAVGRGVMALDAIIDGVVSRQVGLDGVGAAPIPEVRASATSLLMRNSAELDVVPRGAIEDSPATIVPIDGFIAVDLLRVDGISLLDVPLLERKRILESVIKEGELLRTSAHVRPPIETWISTWKAMGLRGGILKAANSRYHPGDDSIEWRLVERVGRH
jgi:bifunctional non-homologous end joining protein LigD